MVVEECGRTKTQLPFFRFLMGVEDCSQVDHWWVVEVCGIKKVELGGGGGVWHEKPKHIHLQMQPYCMAKCLAYKTQLPTFCFFLNGLWEVQAYYVTSFE